MRVWRLNPKTGKKAAYKQPVPLNARLAVYAFTAFIVLLFIIAQH